MSHPRVRPLRPGWLAAVLAVAAGALCCLLARTPPPAVASGGPALSSRSAILVEERTGQRLVGEAPDARLPIASTTKLMTALVTLEHVHRLGSVFTQNGYYAAAADSQIGLVPGERMTVHDLLLALMLPSADDAAEDLAYNVGGGSVGRFIGMMNARARQLGLSHTHYSTPIGLDTPGNYSSAADLVRLAAYLREHSPFFRRIVALRGAVLHSGSHVRVVANRNDLVYRGWINGVKTGHTLGAGYVLVASATRGGMTLLSAVLGTDSESSRDENTLALLDYGFRSFRLAQPVRQGQVLARPAVQDRPGVLAPLVAGEPFAHVVTRGARVKLRVQAPSEVAGPLPQHAMVGIVHVLVDGREVGRVPLLLAQRLPAVSPVTIAARFLFRGSTLLTIIVLLATGAAGAAVWRRRWRERDRAGPAQA